MTTKPEKPNSQLPTAEKPYDIRARTFEFGVRAIQVADNLPRSPGGYAAANQLARSGTSVGANVEESDGAESRPDKRRSLIIARKEAREAGFWLRVIQRQWPAALDVKSDITEASELVRILSTIIRRIGAP